MKNKRQYNSLLLLIAAIGLFYLTTIRSGQPWGDDFSQYIHHAVNIAEGRDYRDTGYLYDPITAVIGPRFYPPVFPLILAPVYALFGLNLTAMKVVIITFFLLFLWIFAVSFKDELSFPALVGAVLTLGLSPFFWNTKDEIQSDVPFLFLAYFVLWQIQQAYTSPGNRQQRTWGKAILVGFLLYLVVGTRTAGVILVPTLFIYELVRMKRFTWFSVIAGIAFGFLFLVQRLAIPGSDGYSDQLVFYPRVFLNSLHLYFDAFYAIWENGYLASVQTGLFVTLIGLASIGGWIRLRRGITSYEIFAALYLITLIIWRANQGMRFLMPLAPLFILYVFSGLIQLLKVPTLQRSAAIATSILMAVILLSYTGSYSKMDFAAFNDGVEKEESQELFDFIRKNTRPEDAFLFNKPRALALYTNREAAGYSTLENELFTLEYARNKDIRYFVVIEGEDYLRLLIKHYPESFEQVYSNAEFNVYLYKK